MLEHIPHEWPVVKNLSMDGSVGWYLKCLTFLHLTIFTAQTSVVQTRVPFLSLSGSGRGDLNIYNDVYQKYCKELAGWCA